MNATALNVSSCNPMLPMVKVVNKGFFISSVYVQIIDWVGGGGRPPPSPSQPAGREWTGERSRERASGGGSDR